MRLLLKSGRGRESETAQLMDSILEGRWMSSVVEEDEHGDIELPEFTIDHILKDSPSLDNGELDIAARASRSRGGIWEAALASPVGQEVSRLYRENRLLVDIALLVGLGIVLVMIPI